eukprot:TRINITY_DN141_c2_g1_i1.p2 TRINITY_DN141_c2_g1~~TRINITY_DN141_c2_g1_i1.p2  ORF type:complete len:243 (-),score=90.11 TRINITY_DN141_c2_g1_i1:105-794(-)
MSNNISHSKSDRGVSFTGDVYKYMIAHGTKEHPALTKLRQFTSTHPHGIMQISADQGGFLGWLVRLMGAKKCIEVGVFTGYSAASVALALPEDGKLIACDISEEYTSLGKPFWKEAGVESKIDLRIAPAVDSLNKILQDESEHGTYDFAFIDADKNNYKTYYEQILKLLRVGGVITLDNVLWGGRIVDPNVNDEDTLALRELNDFIYADARVDVSMISVADGLTLVRKL